MRAPMVTHGCVFAQVPIPDHMDLYHLHEEAEPSDRTALEVSTASFSHQGVSLELNTGALSRFSFRKP